MESYIKAEWKQLLRTKKLKYPMVAILFISVLYAGMLYGNLNPYANMNDLPVAIVNFNERRGNGRVYSSNFGNNYRKH